MSKSQIIVVTGTSNGFGFDVVKALAQRGHRVYAGMRGTAGRNQERAEALRAFAREHSLALEPVEMDVTSTTSVNDAIALVLGKEGRIDVAINNAGIMTVGVSEAFTTEQFESLLQTNVVGCLRVNQAVLPAMRQQRSGLLIHVSSIAGRLVLPFIALYNASKFALEAMVEGLRYEVSQLGIESVIVEPGPFGTNLAAVALAPSRTSILEGYSSMSELMTKFGQSFENLFSAGDVTNPRHVVDALVELVQMDPGTRPLRTVVGMDLGVKELNAIVEPMRQAALQSMDLSHLDTIAGS
jgi:NAD(P)-dependent dehydrogenase (short-subunit alcohol dehydrogenase family)